MKVIKLKESDLVNTIKNILNEQSGGSMISEKGYKAIEDIESTFSFTDAQGNIKGATYDGRANENAIKKYVGDTIGLDNWFKMNELFRTQIYAFMFQSDSGSNDVRHNRWIAGLAQAIDPSVNRSAIMDKKITDTNVAKAIDSIKKACEDNSINKFYNSYLKVLDNQYASIKIKNLPHNYEKIWKNRPRAIERLLNGEKWEIVKKEFNPKTTTQQPVAATKQQPAAAPKQQTQVQGGQDIASIIELSENASTSLRLKSPLAAGKYFEFMIQNETFGCTWRNTINAPYSDDNMRLQVSNRGGKLTLMIVTGDGKKVEMRADGTSCKKL